MFTRILDSTTDRLINGKTLIAMRRKYSFTLNSTSIWYCARQSARVSALGSGIQSEARPNPSTLRQFGWKIERTVSSSSHPRYSHSQFGIEMIFHSNLLAKFSFVYSIKYLPRQSNVCRTIIVKSCTLPITI